MYPLINGAAINASGSQKFVQKTKGIPMVLSARASVSVVAYARDGDALKVGVPKAKSGVDVQLQPRGISMARSLVHQAFQAQPAASVMVHARGKRAMSVGRPAVQSFVSVSAAGGEGLRLGAPRVTQAARAAGVSAMTVGQPGVLMVAQAGGYRALVLGVPRVTAIAAVTQGILMAHAGTARALQGAAVAQAAEGVSALVLGTPGAVTQVAYARQALALELGRPAVARRAQC